MNRKLRIIPSAIALAVALGLATAPALAEKPEWAGQGKGHGKGRDRDDDQGRGRESHRHFNDERRGHVRAYYEEEFRGGFCPPGLAKKHNGCMPPGQARTWRMGQPLPRGVAVYDLPPALVVQIGVPPAGYKYVRVVSDILMVAAGTNMVVDAVRDLGRIR